MSLFEHRFHEDSSEEFGTPIQFVRPLATALDGFDVDPASGAEAQPLASTRYDESDDGLAQEWHGDVWLNPPFSEKTEWVRKARREVRAGRADTVVLLLPVDTSTSLFHNEVVEATVICFVEGRLSFVGGGRNPSFGVLVAVYGDAPDDLRDALEQHGTLVDASGIQTDDAQATLGESAQPLTECNRPEVDDG